MINIYYRNIKEKALHKLDEFRAGSWIYVEKPTQEEIDQLTKDFGLDEGLLRDATDLFEVPRLEVEDDIVYIYTRFPFSENEQILTSPVLIAAGGNFVLTISDRPLPGLERFLEHKIDFYTTQKVKFLLILFSHINSYYNSFLHSTRRKIRSMIVQLEKINNRDIIQFVSFESLLHDFLSALVPTKSILNNLLSGKHFKLYEEDKDLIEDLLLSNTQLIELSQNNLRTIVNIREGYSTIMTNNLNRIIKLFTSLTVILTIPTMIASIYGMNINLPLANNPLAFIIIMTSIIIISIILLIIFIKNDWL